jgi:hypothetical protein
MQKLKLHFVGHWMGWSWSDVHMSFRQMGHDDSSSSASPAAATTIVMMMDNNFCCSLDWVRSQRRQPTTI